MRALLSTIVAAFLCTGPQAPTVPALVITGSVTALEGERPRPVRHAHVTLQRDRDVAVHVVDTDADGRYRFEKIQAAGEFRIRVDKAGFVSSEWTIVPRDRLALDVSLKRGAALEGRILTDTAEPLQRIGVTALVRDPSSGALVTVAHVLSDDLGRFRIASLAPREYYVRAENAGSQVPPVPLEPQEVRPEPAVVFYPAAATPASAAPIPLNDAQEVRGIELQLPPPVPIPGPGSTTRAADEILGGSGRIAGRIVAADTSKPLTGALVEIHSEQVLRGRVTTRTDRDGRFQFVGLPPGRYLVSASAVRFLNVAFGEVRPGDGPRPIDLRLGGSFMSADIALPRFGAIEGRLLDEFGDPAPGIPLNALRAEFVAGRKRLIPVISRSLPVTDDRGRFRLSNLQPGNYYVAAQATVFTEQAPSTGGYAPTYYPGRPDAAAARPVSVPIGADAPEISFALIPAKTVTVSGTLFGVSGQGSRGSVLLKLSDSSNMQDFSLATGTADSEGRFVFRNVPPGEYTIQATEAAPKPTPNPFFPRALPFGWTKITVAGSDLGGLAVRTSPGHTLRGRFVVEDGTNVSPKVLTLMDAPVEFDSARVIGAGPAPQTIADDLSFEVRNLHGVVRLIPDIRDASVALAKITLDSRDVTDESIDFRRENLSGVEVVLTRAVSHVTGEIRDDRGAPRVDYAVVVFTTDSAKWRDRSRFVVRAQPNQEGRFDARGLPPGDYLAVALPTVGGFEYFDPDFLEAVRPLATRFTLAPGERKTLALEIKRRP